MILTSTPSRLRASALVAGGVASVLLLTGCGRSGSDATAASSDTVDDSPATGTVTLWAPDGDATALDEVLADYEADNPDLDLEVTLIPSDEYNTKLQTAISSGTAPDIAQVYTEAQTSFLASGAFAPVPDDLVDSSSFFGAAWEAGDYEGTTYSVPWYAYTRVLIYRSDLAEAGNAVVPTTWDETKPFFEALEAGGAETAYGGEVGWDTYTGQPLSLYTIQAGGDLLNSDGTAWTLDTPEMISAIDYMAEPYLDGLSAVDTPQFLDAQPYFVAGTTGSMVSGPWVIAALDTVADQEGWTAEHVGTAPLPAGADSGVGQIAGGSWVVSADSENQSSAWKVIREMSQPDTQIAQYKGAGSLPAVTAAWDDPSIADNPLFDAFFTQLSDSVVLPSVPTLDQITTVMGQEMEAVARGTETAEEAAANIQSQADSIGVGN